VTRYEAGAPGELVHVDIKKLGRIPDGGGWRVHGRGSTQDRRADAARDRAARAGAAPSRGYRFVHHAVDDHSRLAYSEILADERKETAAEFWIRARDYFAGIGIEVHAVMTDNGSCYRSHVFAAALGPAKHRRTRPYRPQTNGKVERFHQTMAREWAYGMLYLTYRHRQEALRYWICHYNERRPHSALGGSAPISRVRNLCRQDI
jgi:transposase InsO family protein